MPWWIMLLVALAGTALFVRFGLKSKKIAPDIDSDHEFAIQEFRRMLERYDQTCREIRTSFSERESGK